MAAILKDASKEAERVINRLADKAGIGSQVRRAQLRVMRSALDNVATDLFAEIGSNLKSNIKNAAAYAASGESIADDALFASLGVHIPELERAIVAKSAAASLSARAANGIPLSEQVYKTKALSSGLVDRQVNRAIALGYSARELADSVKGMILPSTPGGVSYAAQRLGRTELNNAFHRSQVTANQGKPWVHGMLWHLSGSHPKPDECNQYAETDHDGLGVGVFKMNNVPGKPHPQCLCYVTAKTASREEFINGFMNGDYATYVDSTIYSSGIPTVC